jgi:hypothetical protein
MKLSPKKRSRLAAALAVSNLGHRVPEDIHETFFGWSDTPESEIGDLAGHLMESNEHEHIFYAEAEMWGKYLDRIDEESLLRFHGPHSPWIEKILNVPEESIK